VLRLSDTSVRLYRKKDWSVSVRLRSYLMIHIKRGNGFNLGTYLNQMDCTLTFEDGRMIQLDEYSYGYDCTFSMKHMIYDFHASGIVQMDSIKDGAALLEIKYRLFSSPGQGEPDQIKLVVPVLARGEYAKRWSKQVD
jgi:hypothetical protein